MAKKPEAETSDLRHITVNIPNPIDEFEAHDNRPAPILTQLGHIKGYEAHAIHQHLLEMRNHLDSAVKQAQATHPQVADWLRKLKADL